MAPKHSIEYSLLEPVSSTEEFLKTTFHCSSSKLKKYFDKSFLNRSFKEKTTLVLPIDFVNDGEINPVYDGPAIKILHEDELFLVMDKPANLFVHPLTYEEKNNCLSFLRTVKPQLLNVNRAHYDRGLLYRLDFETSGVLIYVKNDVAYNFLRENFRTVAKKKIYHCLVEGECKLKGEFTHYFSSSEAKGKRVVVSAHADGGEKGEFTLLPKHYDPQNKVTLMEVSLKTGLRHQIRAQLAHLGFPIRGDKFYGGKEAQRLYLHALNYELEYNGIVNSFNDPVQNFNGL